MCIVWGQDAYHCLIWTFEMALKKVVKIICCRTKNILAAGNSVFFLFGERDSHFLESC